MGVTEPNVSALIPKKAVNYALRKAMGKELSNVVYFCDRPHEYPLKVLERLKSNKEAY